MQDTTQSDMIDSEGAAAIAAPGNLHQMNLRQVQDEALAMLYMLTSICGFGVLLLGLGFPSLPQFGFLGLFLMFAPVAARAALGRRYLVSAWMLAAIWSAAIATAIALLPMLPLQSLIILPVMLAVLLIGARPGMFGALVATIVAFAGMRVGSSPSDVLWATSACLLWGTFLLCLVALKPTTDALSWSWQHYEEARQQADQARENQADLKQALQDLGFPPIL